MLLEPEQERDLTFSHSLQAILDEDASLAFTGPDAPEGWQPRNMLVFGVKYVPPSKSMVTEKSDAELEEVFNQIDKDGGGSVRHAGTQKPACRTVPYRRSSSAVLVARFAVDRPPQP